MYNKLKVFRATKKVSQTKLATDLGVSRQTISNIERNIFIPTLQLAFKIADYFKVKVEDIFIDPYKDELIKDEV